MHNSHFSFYSEVTSFFFFFFFEDGVMVLPTRITIGQKPETEERKKKEKKRKKKNKSFSIYMIAQLETETERGNTSDHVVSQPPILQAQVLFHWLHTSNFTGVTTGPGKQQQKPMLQCVYKIFLFNRTNTELPKQMGNWKTKHTINSSSLFVYSFFFPPLLLLPLLLNMK
jgi:hypothetical protein